MHIALLTTLLALPAAAATADKDEPAPRVQGLTVSHGPVSIREFAGEVVIVHFWATWCAPCLADLDLYAEQDSTLRTEGIRFIAVNVDEKHELKSVEDLARTRGWDFPILLDPSRRMAGTFHSKRSVPVTAIIDPEGILKELHLSWDEGDVDQALDEARELRKAAAPNAPTDATQPAVDSTPADSTPPGP